MREKQFRNKINWFTFVFSILVVWVHSYNSELFLGKTQAAEIVWRIEHFFGDTIAQIAVPGFFMISSYLFFRTFSWDQLWKKWNSRIRTILVPYIVWNFIYYLGYVIASRIYVLRDIVGKGEIPFHLQAASEAILHYSYNYVFWYLYQLILLILLAPVIYVLLRRRCIAYVYMVLLLVGIQLRVTLPGVNLDALFYYSGAAFCAIHGKRQAEGRWNKGRGILGIFVLLCSALLYVSAIRSHSVLFQVSYRFCMPVGLWLTVNENRLPAARPWMKNNFFLYAVHFAFVRLINKTGALLLPAVWATPLVLYFAMPFLMTAISYGLAILLRRISKKGWNLLTGSREA